MMNGVISPSLLHKDSANDVLIRNPRKSLLLTPNKEQVAEIPIELVDYYRIDKENTYEFGLSKKTAKDCHINHRDNEYGQDAVWHNNRGLPYQLVETVIPEINGLSVKTEAGRDAINDLLTQREISGHQATSLEMINTANHYFFYSKMHEHVPGVMLIEAARQAVYYHLYANTDHVCGQVTVSLSELKANFYAYADLMYPIELVVDNVGQDSTRHPKKIYYRVAFYQRQVLLAVIDTTGVIINVDLFKKIRNAYLSEQDWFMPLNPDWVSCSLTTQDNKKHIVSLLGITTQRCITTLPATLAPQSIMGLELVLDRKMHFNANIVPGTSVAGLPTWHFQDLSVAALHAMKEIVKRGFVNIAEEDMEAIRESS